MAPPSIEPPIASGLDYISEIEAMLQRQGPPQESPKSSRDPSRTPPSSLPDYNTAVASAKAATPPLWQKWHSNVDEKAHDKKSDFVPAIPNAPKKLHRTAYLDGLRGIAALLVLILHNQVWARMGNEDEQTLENAFGWNNRYHLATFPGIRLIFTGGHAGVPIFFIISGYVLVNKPLSLIHQGEFGPLAESLCSAMFRRWLRLYVPVAATTILWALSWHVFGVRSSLPGARLPEKNIFDELWMWYCEFKNFSFVFNGKLSFAYNHNMWTIPLEFRGSMVVWTSVLAFARCTTTMRLALEFGLASYFMFVVDGWYLSLFMTGVLLCDLDLLMIKGQVPPSLSRLVSRKPQWLVWILFASGLYLAGIPSVNREVELLRQQPGWYYLSYFKPQAVWDIRNFYRSVAAVLLMISVPRLSIIKKFFETDALQYLGRISFALYLVHGPVLWSIGDRVYAAVGRVQPHQIGVIPAWINAFHFPDFGLFCLEANTLAAQLILIPLTFGLAEAVTVLIDEPSVRLAQWLLKGTETRAEQRTVLKRFT